MASSTISRFPVETQLVPTLTCEFCRKRKIKCDKLNPCTNCRRAGVNCETVRRRRLPRGRHTSKPTSVTQNLQDKIDRLEALVHIALAGSSNTSSVSASGNELSPDSITMHGSSQKDLTSNHSLLSNSSATDENSATPQLWSNLLKEIREFQGLASNNAEEEEDDGNEKDEDQGSSPALLVQNQTYSRFIGLSLGQFGGVPLHSLSLRPSPAVTAALCSIYLDQVDRIVKVLHRTSLKQHLIEGKPYSAHMSSSNAEEALDAAVFYAAVASMTDRQCQSLFHCNKLSVLPEYQKACEMSLERADLTRTTDITVLQAFVLYLVATRVHDKSRAVWTLLATAVRIAQAINLHVESLHPSETFFSKQTRKRLWFTLCLLDMQTSIDPDSKLLIPFEMTQTAPPSNLNDSDFDISYQGTDLPEHGEITDMTFALITYRLQAFGRHLHCTAMDGNHNSTREELVMSFENDVLQLTRYCNPDDNNYSWLVHYGSQSLIASAKLVIIRPLMAIHNGIPPPAQEYFSILELYEKVLENTPRMQNDERGEGFRWYITPQWPALVLAIRECYVSTDVAGIKRVWPLVQDVFEQYKNAHTIPIKRARVKMLSRLIETTRERVDRLIQSSPADNRSLADSADIEMSQGVENTLNHPVAYSESQATNLIDPSWIAWENFMNELSSGQLPNDGLCDWEDNLFIKPDMIFPFT